MNESIKDFKRTAMCGELRKENIGEEKTLMGWVQRARNLGGLIFIDLRDSTGISQIVVNDDVDEEVFKKAEKLRSEYVIGVKGIVEERQSKNPDMLTGDIELIADELRILNKSQTPPIYIKDDDDVSDNTKLKYRYLDLRKPRMQEIIKLRAKTSKVIRDFLDEEGFLEVETPMLNKPTPEGARDYLVPSRVNRGKFYALPQSPQQMKQLLMVSGVDKYYQIARCFRDEDLRANRQPEFTQIDLEMAFIDKEDIIDLNERLIQRVFKDIKGIDIQLPLKKLTYKEAMERFGSDKPYTNFGYELVDLSDILKDSEFKVFSENIKDGGMVQGINIKAGEEKISSRGVRNIESFVKDYGAKGIVDFRLKDGEAKSGIAKFLSEEEIENIIKALDGEEGDILFIVADKPKVVYDSLGALRLKIAKDLDIIDQDKLDLLWVTEFPMFEENEEGIHSVHHPFTAPMDEYLEKLSDEPLKAKSKAYDMVINGEELGGGSIRINNTDLQEEVFKILGLEEEEIQIKFGHLLEAFKYGTPPHGGLAYGLDRLIMILAETDNIRDVIAFPKTQQATDIMMDAPTIVDDLQLEELGIDVKVSEKNED